MLVNAVCLSLECTTHSNLHVRTTKASYHMMNLPGASLCRPAKIAGRYFVRDSRPDCWALMSSPSSTPSPSPAAQPLCSGCGCASALLCRGLVRVVRLPRHADGAWLACAVRLAAECRRQQSSGCVAECRHAAIAADGNAAGGLHLCAVITGVSSLSTSDAIAAASTC